VSKRKPKAKAKKLTPREDMQFAVVPPPEGTQAAVLWQRLGAAPIFTHEELLAILFDLRGMPWQPDKFFAERRSVLAKLRKYAGE
jgi:hypothetical protein